MGDLRIARRHATPETAGSGSVSASGDSTREALRRLRWIAGATSVMPLLLLGITAVIAPPGSPQRDALGSTAALFGLGVLVSIATFVTLGNERIAPSVRLDVGFGFQVALAFVIGVFRHLMPWAPGDGFREISPVSAVILIFAAVVPNKPRRTLLASLSAAAMDPLGLVIAVARGNAAPPAAQVIVICLSPFMAAGVSTVISSVVHNLARSADEAKRLGSYLLTERLGAGGMGEVWRAEHRMLARPAAIKLIRAESVGDVGAVRRFEREALATSTLQSPHTIHLYDFGITDDGTFYYVMELLDGLDLDELVRRDGPQPAERVVHILRQVCESLDEAHHRGLVHRDVKPANIYVCRYARELDFVKVLDFGLVKPRDATSAPAELAPTLTIDGALAGTPAFLAPEMALGEKEIDGRADVYALGCVGYWLLTGQLVFEAETPMKMILRHLQAAPAPPSDRTELTVPAALDRLLLECLEKEPSKRPASAAELGQRLAAIELAEPWSRARAAVWGEAHAGAKRAPVDDALASTMAS